MSDGFWDRFAGSDGFVSFKEVGDSIVGTVLDVRLGKDFNGNPCPELLLDTEDGTVTLTAGQVMLKHQLAEVRPGVGDKIAVVYSGVGEAQPGKAPAKLFEVDIQRGDTGAPPQAAPAESTSTAAPARTASSLLG